MMRGGRSRAATRVGVSAVVGALAWALPLAWTQPAAAQVTIDNFNAAIATWPKDQNTIGNPEIEFAPGAGADLIGEYRKTSIYDFSPGGGISRVEVGVFPSVPTSFLEYISSVNTDAALKLRYDASADPGGANPNLNFDMTANSRIDIVFSYFDYANSLPMDVQVTISDGTNSALVVQQLAAIVAMPTLSTLSFDFSGGLGGVDLSDVDWIEVDFDPGAAADFRVQSILAVPEPASVCLLALGVLAIGRRYRR